ncbi:hypothetical protein MS3_00007099 [Schistosoma haematobium]|uniref:Uncharacterized protein n=1 Tax=Schistosoma haematobium TaxID=6185 RepID=A0A6A5DQA4_SCHHA|nr:hypothetical protein MS3_00007099 [Schistosoma haematobium]KAH9586041.1 hypothetical protein MS3_00007099 [Schistosoma haematobium]
MYNSTAEYPNRYGEQTVKKTFINRSGSFNKTLPNFIDIKNKNVFEGWREYSDKVQRSKATLVPLYEQSFAGVHKIIIGPVLPAYDGAVIDLHRQGLNSTFKLIFYENCVDVQNCVSYKSNFETSGVRQQIEIPFSKFTLHCRGRRISNTIP